MDVVTAARLDEELLRLHRRFEDRDGDYSEEFLQPVLGSGRTVAVLSRPLGEALPVGWVVCHSLGIEQIHLGRLDVILARSLSAAGFPVLRFHGQGYGDSEQIGGDVGLSSHVADATDAVALMREIADVDHVGAIGARFGGTVSALVADRAGLPLLAVFAPVTSGRRYMRDLLRQHVFSGMVREDDGSGGTPSLLTRLANEGWCDVNGFRLTRRAHDEIRGVELGKDVRQFGGRSLIVDISRTGTPSPAVRELYERLVELGGSSTFTVLQDPLAAQFGQFHFLTKDGGTGKHDVRADLDQAIVGAATAWATLQIKGLRTSREHAG